MAKGLTISIVRYIVSFLGILLIFIGLGLWWAIGDQLPQFSRLEMQQPPNVPALAAPELLKVSTYNIGHGQGIKDHATDYRDKPTTLMHLNLLADAIKGLDSDIVFLQEVDLDSNRTHHINQIEFIRERTGYPYHACANLWEKNYIPFPYWPPAHHIGYVRAANCVLSRFPLSNHERVIFDKPETNPFWYNWAYIDRGIERVDVQVGQEKIALLNLHLEAWGEKTREKQIKDTIKFMSEINLPIILGGDFNTVFPDAPKMTGFADEPETDYANEKTVTWLMDSIPELKVGKLGESITNTFHLFTYPSNNPNRRLDHFFLKGPNLSFVEYKVNSEAGVASDHLPVTAVIKYH